MKKNNKNLILENNITKNYFKNNLYKKDKIKLNKFLKDIYNNLDNKKDTFHFLSKKFILKVDKDTLKKFEKYKSIILIGMGGSVLGAQSIYSFLKQKINKDFIFLDNLDQLKLEEIKKKIILKNTLFIIISKSGNTIETLVNSNLLKEKINSKNTIIITEKKKTIY